MIRTPGGSGSDPLRHIRKQIEDLLRQSEARFQELERVLVDLLDAVENLPGLDAKRQKNLQDRRDHLQQRRQQPRPPL
jgi:predicted  nucleic acid-binding Zn-ribbon protein